MPELTCPICSEKFYRKPSHVAAVDTSYCSQKCSSKSQRNGKSVNCNECGKEVYRSKQYLDKHEHFFCSQECAKEWRKDTFKRQKHGNWKHGKHVHKDILKEHSESYICVLCGEGDLDVLVAHHIDEDRENNDPSNLEWLCHNCHHLVHNYTDPKEQFKELINA